MVESLRRHYNVAVFVARRRLGIFDHLELASDRRGRDVHALNFELNVKYSVEVDKETRTVAGDAVHEVLRVRQVGAAGLEVWICDVNPTFLLQGHLA